MALPSNAVWKKKRKEETQCQDTTPLEGQELKFVWGANITHFGTKWSDHHWAGWKLNNPTEDKERASKKYLPSILRRLCKGFLKVSHHWHPGYSAPLGWPWVLGKLVKDLAIHSRAACVYGFSPLVELTAVRLSSCCSSRTPFAKAPNVAKARGQSKPRPTGWLLRLETHGVLAFWGPPFLSLGSPPTPLTAIPESLMTTPSSTISCLDYRHGHGSASFALVLTADAPFRVRRGLGRGLVKSAAQFELLPLPNPVSGWSQ